MAQIKNFSPGEPLDISNLNAMLQEIKDNRGLINATKNTVDALDKTRKQTIAKVLNGTAPDAAGRTITQDWTTGLVGTFQQAFTETPSVAVTPVYTGNNVVDIRVTKITKTQFTFDAKLAAKGSISIVFYWIAVAQQEVV